MRDNKILDVIRKRRSILRFREEAVSDQKLDMVLEAGRWAPSYANSQPWTFIVVRDEAKRKALENLVLRISLASTSSGSVAGPGLGDAPVVIAVVVDPLRDPRHYIEAGAAAVQNMALAAHSLGLATFWAGVFALKSGRKSAEAMIKRLLEIPKDMRVIALLPLGVPAYDSNERTEIIRRKDLSELVRHESFSG
jgi:nitroreductase